MIEVELDGCTLRRDGGGDWQSGVSGPGVGTFQAGLAAQGWTVLFGMAALLLVAGCAGRQQRPAAPTVAQTAPPIAPQTAPATAPQTPRPPAPLRSNELRGDLAPVRDPSVFLQNGTYYVVSTDPGDPRPGRYLRIRCSPDGVNWRECGQVFTSLPEWVRTLPGVNNLWAPDISFFHGLYHVYYAGSKLGSQNSVIGLATNTTLDPADPQYRWVDRGEVLASHSGDDFNAIDPNILVDRKGQVWLQYGSYWSGIKQREIDPGTGMLPAADKTRWDLAKRPQGREDAIEGASLVRHGEFYYLFLSIDHCCLARVEDNDYKEMVGRSSSPHGPFVDRQGTPLLGGGATLLLVGNERWAAPGGGSVFVNPQGDAGVMVFHALNMSDHAAATLWLKHITWAGGWPVLE